MRLIRPRTPSGNRRPLLLALLMLGVGAIAAGLAARLPGASEAAGPLALAAALGLGVGVAWLIRAVTRRPASPIADELGRLLGDAFDESWVLIAEPRLPGVSRDLAGLLVGPAGVRALVVRRWRGRYRVRGRGWEYDTRDRRRGWIRCRTNPSFDADSVAGAVSAWARAAQVDEHLEVIGATAFPYGHSKVVLEEPGGEVVTTDNAPWWANSIGRVRRLDPRRVAVVVEAVMAATEASVAVSPAARAAQGQRT
ncbi:MAG TPA: hypothetical protein VFM19_09050 [Candidatus Limnocylindria bacterium]|nr:hypothetical protein [Candidatus Limnocylindria bacterium]